MFRVNVGKKIRVTMKKLVGELWSPKWHDVGVKHTEYQKDEEGARGCMRDMFIEKYFNLW